MLWRVRFPGLPRSVGYAAFTKVFLLAGLVAGSSGCADRTGRYGLASSSNPDAGGEGRLRPLVELFSWWTAPGEAGALEALVAAHRARNPGARLFNAAAASGANAREVLARRLSSDYPPDLFQENAHDLRAAVAAGRRRVEPLNDLFEALNLNQTVYPEVIQNVTWQGRVFALPVNVHRENALFYNKRLLSANGISPPATFDEFMAACKKLKAAGLIPVATAHHGWILRVMFNSVAIAKMGSTAYQDYFTGKSKEPLPKLREAMVAFGDILANYTNPDGGEEGFNWTNAAQALYNNDAAFFLHGDWAKGYFMQLGWTPGVDFGVVGAPGASDVFLYGVDVFALPDGAHNEAGARAFLSTVASVQAQVAFNRAKGSSSIRKDVAKEGLDPVALSTLNDLERAKIRMLVHSRNEWDDAIAEFARKRDVDALYRAYVTYPPEL